MKGPYDDELSWPLCSRFKVQLLNQTSDKSHHSSIASVDNANKIVSNKDYSVSKFKAAAHDNGKEVWQDSEFIRIMPIPSQYLKIIL